MRREEFTRKWQGLKAAWTPSDARVNGAWVAQEVLTDAALLWAAQDSTWVPMREAKEITEVDESTLRRWARVGKVIGEKRGRSWWFLAGSLPRNTLRTALTVFDPAQAARDAFERVETGTNKQTHAKE